MRATLSAFELFNVWERARGASLAVGLALLAADAAESAKADPLPWSGGAKPSFSIESLSGVRIDLARQIDRVVLVHFFATWCEPCRPELSALHRLADRFAQRPLTVLAIDVGEPDARVHRFFDSFPVSFPILLDRDKTVTKAWEVSTLPTTFVLDRTLRPRFMVEGDLDWERPGIAHTIEMLMNTKSTSSALN
jgi:thiol-disulfide isomerase/thioredoxin